MAGQVARCVRGLRMKSAQPLEWNKGRNNSGNVEAAKHGHCCDAGGLKGTVSAQELAAVLLHVFAMGSEDTKASMGLCPGFRL